MTKLTTTQEKVLGVVPKAGWATTSDVARDAEMFDTWRFETFLKTDTTRAHLKALVKLGLVEMQPPSFVGDEARWRRVGETGQ